MIRLFFVIVLFLIYGNFNFVLNDIVVFSLINIAFFTVLKEKNIKIIENEMISVKDSDLHSFSIPLLADINIGDNWGDLH